MNLSNNMLQYNNATIFYLYVASLQSSNQLTYNAKLCYQYELLTYNTLHYMLSI